MSRRPNHLAGVGAGWTPEFIEMMQVGHGLGSLGVSSASMTNEDYHKQLEQVADALTSAGCQVSIRGDGAGRFVFAQHRGRAVEVYRGEQDVYVECFPAGEEYSSTELHEQSYEAATQRALDWLSQT